MIQSFLNHNTSTPYFVLRIQFRYAYFSKNKLEAISKALYTLDNLKQEKKMNTRRLVLTASTFLLSPFWLYASTIDICDRGRIGELITKEIESIHCSKVDKEKISKLKYLNLSGKEIKEIPENAFSKLDSLKELSLDYNQIKTH